MSTIVPAEDIERIVGATRQETDHVGRANSSDMQVYILHSKVCLAKRRDLRLCRFSLAMDRGIPWNYWPPDLPVTLQIVRGFLVPTLLFRYDRDIWRSTMMLRLAGAMRKLMESTGGEYNE